MRSLLGQDGPFGPLGPLGHFGHFGPPGPCGLGVQPGSPRPFLPENVEPISPHLTLLKTTAGLGSILTMFFGSPSVASHGPDLLLAWPAWAKRTHWRAVLQASNRCGEGVHRSAFAWLTRLLYKPQERQDY